MQPTVYLSFRMTHVASCSHSSIYASLFCLLKFCRVWCLILCVILAGLWCPDMLSNIILDISVSFFFFNMRLTLFLKRTKKKIFTSLHQNSARWLPLTWTLALALPGSLDCHPTLQILELPASIIMWSNSLK